MPIEGVNGYTHGRPMFGYTKNRRYPARSVNTLRVVCFWSLLSVICAMGILFTWSNKFAGNTTQFCLDFYNKKNFRGL